MAAKLSDAQFTSALKTLQDSAGIFDSGFANLVTAKMQAMLRSENANSPVDDGVNKLANKMAQMGQALLLLYNRDLEKEKRIALLESEMLKKQSIEKFKSKTVKIKQMVKDSQNELKMQMERKLFEVQ